MAKIKLTPKSSQENLTMLRVKPALYREKHVRLHRLLKVSLLIHVISITYIIVTNLI